MIFVKDALYYDCGNVDFSSGCAHAQIGSARLLTVRSDTSIFERRNSRCIFDLFSTSSRASRNPVPKSRCNIQWVAMMSLSAFSRDLVRFKIDFEHGQ